MAGFYEPMYLLLLLLIPIIFYLYLKFFKKSLKKRVAFSKVSVINEIKQKKYIKNHYEFILEIILFTLLILALANPYLMLKNKHEGVNVVLAIDISGSMTVEDYPPNRLEAAKSSAKLLIEQLEDEDFVGIVGFSSGASTISYLSSNQDVALEKLNLLQSDGGATAIGDGLALSVEMAKSIPNKKSIVIFLSDGENNAGRVSPDDAINLAKKEKLQVYSIAMGSNQPVVMGYDFFGNPQYASLDEELLSKIATETNGKYFKTVDSKTLREVYSSISQDIKRVKEKTSIRIYVLLLLFLVLIYYFYVKYLRI